MYKRQAPRKEQPALEPDPTRKNSDQLKEAKGEKALLEGRSPGPRSTCKMTGACHCESEPGRALRPCVFWLDSSCYNMMMMVMVVMTVMTMMVMVMMVTVVVTVVVTVMVAVVFVMVMFVRVIAVMIKVMVVVVT